MRWPWAKAESGHSSLRGVPVASLCEDRAPETLSCCWLATLPSKASGQPMPSHCRPTALQGKTQSVVSVAQASLWQVSSCHHPTASNPGGMGQVNPSLLSPGIHEVLHVIG